MGMHAFSRFREGFDEVDYIDDVRVSSVRSVLYIVDDVRLIRMLMKVNLVATDAGDIGVFLLTTAALEIVRRFSSDHCPFIWRGLQALQVLCCPPFKWIQKWAPFTSLVKGMQTLSRPLLFLSVATCLFNESGSSKGTLNGSSAELTELSSQLATQDTRLANNVSRSVVVKDWLVELYAELDKQDLTVPERCSSSTRPGISALSNPTTNVIEAGVFAGLHIVPASFSIETDAGKIVHVGGKDIQVHVRQIERPLLYLLLKNIQI
ncbi:hypothetical protein L1987_19120 [Smallanthus sonchifolius]|uniref:Uncharacterized protein n=1 Tax=Smallanthus sonchifolius TaxID=185202 RepID=A0ACB9J2N1_9ASTR|nr:hypothetical protein L1987_19120 [Smallanthus sonchifolius]